jgi:DNA-binding transcriptional LysR family regulator
MAPAWSLARKKSVRFTDVVREPMLILPPASEPAISDAYHRVCASLGVLPNIVMELEQVEALLAFAAAGIGITLMPASVARLGFKGVATVPLKPRVLAEPTLVWDPQRLSPAANALLRELLALRTR